MSVRIRLARIGKKKAPFYRIVAINSRTKRDGKFLENLGTFNPISGEMVQFHADKIQAWIDKGAIPSDSVVKLQKRFKRGELGALAKVEPVRKHTPSKAELEAQAAEEAKAAEAAQAKEAAEKPAEEAPAEEKPAEDAKAETKEEASEEKAEEAKASE